MHNTAQPEGIAHIAAALFVAGWHETAPPQLNRAEGEWTAWTSPDRTVLAIAATRGVSENDGDDGDEGRRLDIDIRGCHRRRSTWTAPDWLICLDGWPHNSAVTAAMSAATPEPTGNRSLTQALLQHRWTHQLHDDPGTGSPVRIWTSPRHEARILLGPRGWHLTRPGIDGPAHAHGTNSLPPALIKDLMFSH